MAVVGEALGIFSETQLTSIGLLVLASSSGSSFPHSPLFCPRSLSNFNHIPAFPPVNTIVTLRFRSLNVLTWILNFNVSFGRNRPYSNHTTPLVYIDFEIKQHFENLDAMRENCCTSSINHT